MQEKNEAPPARARGFRRHVGYTTTAWRDGFAEIELILGPEHMNSLNIVHGGVYMTLLDAALGHAVCWCSVPGHARFAVTVSLATTFVDSAQLDENGQGKLIATGRLDGIHERIGTTTGEVRDGYGRLCATGVATFRYFAGSEHIEGVAKRRNI
ncbi:MAG: PaaI family thioesterase [Hyphomicrobiaceae bacterium]